jgi:hypothetical protein
MKRQIVDQLGQSMVFKVVVSVAQKNIVAAAKHMPPKPGRSTSHAPSNYFRITAKWPHFLQPMQPSFELPSIFVEPS